MAQVAVSSTMLAVQHLTCSSKSQLDERSVQQQLIQVRTEQHPMSVHLTLICLAIQRTRAKQTQIDRHASSRCTIKPFSQAHVIIPAVPGQASAHRVCCECSVMEVERRPKGIILENYMEKPSHCLMECILGGFSLKIHLSDDLNFREPQDSLPPLLSGIIRPI